MALLDIFSGTYTSLAYSVAILTAATVIYRIFFHPLSHIPGPAYAYATPFFHWIISLLGVEIQLIDYYHRRYQTKVLRIAPSFVSVSDVEALHPIYIAHGGFPKDAGYRNFDVRGHANLFSSVDVQFRDLRAKAVLPMFSPALIRSAEGDQNIHRYVEKYVWKLHQAKEHSLAGSSGSSEAVVDLLGLSLRLSIDCMTGYMFDQPYGDLDEAEKIKDVDNGTTALHPEGGAVSTISWVHAISSVGHYSVLPAWIFSLVMSASIFFWDLEQESSVGKVEQHINTEVVASASTKPHTYQGRLLSIGATLDEISATCEGTLFAATSSTGLVLAVIIFHLIQNPSIRQKLKDEGASVVDMPDPWTRPYIRAVVQEGLRMSRANMAPLTRAVPREGLVIDGKYIPGGTTVGASTYLLHYDPAVFIDPFRFCPERWLSAQSSAERQQCEKNFLPFGLGSRSCIGRTLAMHQLYVAVTETVQSGVLDGAQTCQDKIEMYSYFNSEVKGNSIPIRWVGAETD